MPRRLLSAGTFLPISLCLLAGYRVASCRPPPPCIAFRRTAASRVHPRPPLFVSAGWLLCRILSHRLRLSTRRRLACCLLRHLHLTSARLPSLAPQFSSPPLSAPRPSPASSNTRRTLPAVTSPTATVHPTCPPPPPHRHLYSSTIHHHCPTLVISWRKVMTRRLFCSRLTGTHK